MIVFGVMILIVAGSQGLISLFGLGVLPCGCFVVLVLGLVYRYRVTVICGRLRLGFWG